MQDLSNHSLLERKLDDLSKFKLKINSTNFDHSISCNYHGINLNFKTKSPKFIQSLKKIIPESWICSPNSQIMIYLMDPSEFGYTPESWCDEASQDCISYENNTIAIQRDFAAQVMGDNVFLICEDNISDGFYNFLRWYLSEKLMDIGKFVVHASCVLDKHNGAHLFLGHSGAGKTTITKLSAPRLVLGDDMNLVSLENNILYVEAGAIGGLFNSMIGYDKKNPVKAIYWLKQSKENIRVEQDSLIANQKFLASFANLHWETLPQQKIEQLMEFSLLATTHTTFYELQFQNSSAIWEYLDP